MSKNGNSYKIHVKLVSFLTEIKTFTMFSNASVSDVDRNKKSESERLKYPIVRRNEFAKNIYHGVEIPNPYEYLEDSNREDTRLFVEEQNALFHSFISQPSSRAKIQKKLKEEWKYTKIGVPMQKGDRKFYWKNVRAQNHSVLYIKETRGDRAILDPNLWSKDGKYSVENVSICGNGKFVAYCMCKNGSDWATIRVRDVDCGHDLDDNIQYGKLSFIRWTKDNKGFFYQRFPRPMDGYGRASGTEISVNLGAKLYYHTLGSNQEDDKLAVEFPNNPTWTIFSEISDDGDYLFIHASDVIGEKYLYCASLKEGIREPLQLTLLLSDPGNHWYLANDDDVLYFMTTVGAKNYHHAVRINLATRELGNGKFNILVPDQGKKVFWAIVVNQNKLVTCYLKDVLCQIEIRDLYSGNTIDKLAIEPGSVTEMYGRRCDKEFHFKLESYVNPGTVYKVEFKEDEIEMEPIANSELKSRDLSAFQMLSYSYSSNDGSNIPMFLIHKKNLVQDNNRPCLYTAYGGYGVSKLPTFNVAYLFFAQHFNGVVAVANIRGGGEYGRNWWDEGRLLNKQNGFEDFIAGARFLMNNAYTKPQKLAITGTSNGGLLIGAVVNKRPDLFGAAIPQVGIMDMLRYDKFTIGHLWHGEFGSPQDETYFNYLRKYSPLHNIKTPEEGEYPAILTLTCDHDDRVVPSHSYKYVAELQHMAAANPKQKNPFLGKVYQNAGHVAGKPTCQLIEEWTDIFTFLELTLDYNFHDS